MLKNFYVLVKNRVFFKVAELTARYRLHKFVKALPPEKREAVLELRRVLDRCNTDQAQRVLLKKCEELHIKHNRVAERIDEICTKG